MFPARIEPLTNIYTKEKQMTDQTTSQEFNVESLKADVVKILVSEHDFLLDDAADSVEESFKGNNDMWNENASAADLAKYLAAEDEDA
jgi:hypothetical protein